MARCKRCGGDTLGNKFVCPSCLKKFTASRLDAFAQVESQLGKLTAENHSEFVKRVKAIERANKSVQRTTPTAPPCTCSMDDGIHEWNCAVEVARRSR